MSLIKSRAVFDRVILQIGLLPLEELLSALLGEIAVLLDVERVGYSRMEDEGELIQQDIQYLRATGRCDGALVSLKCADYPGYFAALQDPSRLIVSDDVMSDARLAEFRELYFEPLGITSMLDVAVHRSGKLFGVICHEHVGPMRRWTHEEVDLARSCGHLVALAVETQERKEIAEELGRAIEREKELTEMKSNFVNLVSHEFRTPLGIIVSASDILGSYYDQLDPGQREVHLQSIRNSSIRMSHLMEEVLILGKVESGTVACRSEPLDLAAFCRRLVDEQQSATYRKCGISLELEGIDESARGDEDLMNHIFGNLISNAMKYSRDGGPVRFLASRVGEFVHFQIEDKGIGIDFSDQKHLFSAFFRGKNVGDSPGTGLGLVLVKRCVDLHGGSLDFRSLPGEGSCFSVRLKLFPALRRML